MGLITDFLQSLGKTADEVADSLRAMNVKGVTTARGERCPIANAIYKKFPYAWPGLNVRPNGHVTFNDMQILDPRSTDAVCEFVKKFDSGEYADLLGT